MTIYSNHINILYQNVEETRLKKIGTHKIHSNYD